MNLTPQQKNNLIKYYPELKNWLDTRDSSLNTLADQLVTALISKIESVKGEKGDKGDKGDKGLTGAKGDKGDQGDRGEKGDKGERGPRGIDGIDGKHGKDGKDAILEIDEVVSQVISKGVVVKEELDKRDKKVLDGMARIDGRIKLIDQRWGSHGGGGTKTNFVDNEVVAGSGTTFTLNTVPVAGSLKLYGMGQRLFLTTDYTLSGSTITTVYSWSAGQLLADYRT